MMATNVKFLLRKNEHPVEDVDNLLGLIIVVMIVLLIVLILISLIMNIITILYMMKLKWFINEVINRVYNSIDDVAETVGNVDLYVHNSLKKMHHMLVFYHQTNNNKGSKKKHHDRAKNS